MRNYIFYDLETSGRSSRYDQLLQFAAIITDCNFNEVHRVNLRCKLAPHILPSPIALNITGIHPEQLYQSELPNAFEFAQFLQGFIKDNSPATWVGYNSIAFDENFLRQFFYQNLQPDIYATQSFGNDRLDVMKIAWAVYDECNDALEWPLNDRGRVSFKLEHLAPANGFKDANSHDALSDVEATVFLIKKMQKKAPELIGDLLASREKSHVKSLIESNQPLKVTLRFGGPPISVVGVFCGYQKNNPNNFGFLDLENRNVDELLAGSYDDVFKAVTQSPLSIRCLAVNKAETIRKYYKEDKNMLQISQQLGRMDDFRLMVSEALSNKYKETNFEDQPIENQIYSGFFSSDDKRLLFAFQKASWNERQYILEDFNDVRLRILGRRLITFYGPKLNYGNWDERFKEYLYSKWIDADQTVEWNTFSQFDEDLESLRSSNASKRLIEGLEELRFTLFEKCKNNTVVSNSGFAKGNTV